MHRNLKLLHYELVSLKRAPKFAQMQSLTDIYLPDIKNHIIIISNKA